MLSKTIIQFSVDGWGLFPPCCLTWDQTKLEVTKIMATSFKRTWSIQCPKWLPPPVFLPGKSHGWRILLGYSPWGRKESDTTGRIHFTSLQTCSRPLSTQATTGDSWTLTGKSGSFSSGVSAPFSWVLVHTRAFLCPPRVCFPIPVSVLWSNPTGLHIKFPKGFSPFSRSPGWEICCRF